MTGDYNIFILRRTRRIWLCSPRTGFQRKEEEEVVWIEQWSGLNKLHNRSQNRYQNPALLCWSTYCSEDSTYITFCYFGNPISWLRKLWLILQFLWHLTLIINSFWTLQNFTRIWIYFKSIKSSIEPSKCTLHWRTSYYSNVQIPRHDQDSVLVAVCSPPAWSSVVMSEGDNKVSALYQVRTEMVVVVVMVVVNQALLTFLVQKMTAINYSSSSQGEWGRESEVLIVRQRMDAGPTTTTLEVTTPAVARHGLCCDGGRPGPADCVLCQPCAHYQLCGDSVHHDVTRQTSPVVSVQSLWSKVLYII